MTHAKSRGATRSGWVGRRLAASAVLATALIAGNASAQLPRVAWFDLLTEDAGQAARFYYEIFGWELERNAEGNYVAVAGDVPFAGISQIDRTLPGAEATWLIGIEVEDVDASVAKSKSLGSKILQDVVTTDGLAEWAVIEDPQGAPLLLFEAKRRVGGIVGHGAPYWGELWTTELEGSIGFYVELLGWKRSSTDRSGERYPFFGDETDPRAGLMSVSAEEMDTGWAPYFSVKNLSKTLVRARKHGGEVLMEPRPDIDEGRVAILRDPTGVAFIVVEMEKPR